MPEEYGGRGLDYRTYGLIVEEIGRGDSPRAPWSRCRRRWCAPRSSAGAPRSRSSEWLPQLCSGEALGCFGLTEPDTGSDAANLKTRAEKTDGGWKITGQKQWISLGNYAKLALIFAQTDPEKKHRGLAAFLVPTDSRGFSSSRRSTASSACTRSDTAELSLDGVEVPDEALMGEVGDGFKVAMSALDSGRFSVAAGCVGICQGCVDASVDYAKEREQFGRPIASFQLVQEMIADMVVDTDAARGLVWRAGWLKDTGKPNTTETSIAKLYATEAAVRSANTAIQVHGGSGYVDDHPVERYLRDARVTTLYEGTSPDPEADHRPRRDRHQRDGREPSGRSCSPSATARSGIARLNRPDARNALSPELMEELIEHLEAWDADPEVRCIVIAGSDEYFAAGADIKAMRERTFQEALVTPSARFWPRLAAVRRR